MRLGWTQMRSCSCGWECLSEAPVCVCDRVRGMTLSCCERDAGTLGYRLFGEQGRIVRMGRAALMQGMTSVKKNMRIDDHGDVHWKCKCGELFKDQAALRQHRSTYKTIRCTQCNYMNTDITKVSQHQAIAGHEGMAPRVDPAHN